ncbi:hypothetical protein MMC14_001957 [Varicellaria rhodocarpa]|nr:hypothetical protein [Varicellaria rhodocarpa]
MPVPNPIDIDCYAILEILQSADAEAIKRAYRRSSLLRNPDKNLGNPGAHEAFCTLNSAFDILSDPSRRLSYDVDYSNIKSKRDTEARERAKRASDAAEAERQREEQEQWHTIQRRRAEELLKEQHEVKHWNKSAKAREDCKMSKELNILQNLASERIKLASHTRDRERLEQQKNVQMEAMLKTEKQFQVKRERAMKFQQEHLEREAAARRKAAQEYKTKLEEALKK